MIRQLRALLGRARPVPPAPAPLPPPPTLEAELAAGGSSVAAWVAARRSSAGRLYCTLDATRIAQLRDDCAREAAATIAAADRVCRHEFDLLGSGPYVPVDPGRPARGTYRPVDWYVDPVQRLRFPERVPHKQWNLLEMRPGLADVKLPWELGRCQQWLPLAQAFRLTGDTKYATEVLDQLEDFIEANPVGLGVNWTCTMDVAIRALNWSMALELVHGATDVQAGRLEHAYRVLFDHGGFIEQNLENKYEVTSNHFLSNVVGLYAVGVLFQDLPSGQRWIANGRAWLEQEMLVQVLDDGADYESSVPYHRLVAELFLSGWRLAQCEGRELSSSYRAKLHAMARFLREVLRPDGRVPQIGDADDGRVHIFSAYGTWQPQDARHLLAPAAALLGEPSWAETGDPWARWEAAWWGADLPTPAAPRPRCAAELFADAGLAVVRDAESYLLVTNGKVGTNGFGNHKHNDLLSFEFHHRGVPLIVDPGSFVYTSNPDARNAFRSTAAHNTMAIDAEEQNEFKEEWLFRMFEKAKPEHVAFTATDAIATYRGRHDGYARLPAPVIHEREFHLDRRSGTLRVTDDLTGSGTHALVWRFHCAPGVATAADGTGVVVLSAAGRRWRLTFEPGLTSGARDAWYSPSYGVRHRTTTLEFSTRQDLARGHRWSFLLEAIE